MKLDGSIAELVGEWKQWEEKILAYGMREATTSKVLASKLANTEGEDAYLLATYLGIFAVKRCQPCTFQ